MYKGSGKNDKVFVTSRSTVHCSEIYI